jgi:hypothetical protein
MKRIEPRAGMLILMMVLLIGCDTSARKLPLVGQITLGDKPLVEGSISLTSTTGPESTFATVQDGKFSIAADNGVPAGSYRVVILGFESTGRQMEDPDFPGKMIDEKRSVVPSQYNENSQLQVEITANNSQSLSFRLEPR